MNLKIRKAKVQDLEDINSIYNQAVDAKFQTADIAYISIEDRKKWFTEHEVSNYPVYVAVIDNHVAGWLSFSPYRKGRKALRYTAEISYYIDKNYQRKGIGTKLINFAIETAPKLSFKNIFAIILEKNVASIKLLKKLSFEQWAFLPDVADFDGVECGHIFLGLRV